MDWSVWGPPLAVLGLGAVAGLVFALQGSRRFGGRDLEAELRARKQVVMNDLRELEADRDKLDADVFAERKAALVAEAAELLRRIEEPTTAEPAGPATAPKGRALTWLTAVGLLVFFGVTAVSVQQAAQPRRDGASMTGNQDLGGPGEAALDPEVAQALDRLEQNPDDLDALNLLTRVALEGRDLQAGMQYLDRSRKIDPEHPAVLTHLAALQMAIGRYPDAEVQLQAALAKQPGFPEAKIWLALNRGGQGDWDGAEALLNEVTADPASGPRDMAAATSLLGSLKMARAQAEAEAQGAPAAPAGETPAPAGPPKLSGQVRADGELAPGGVLFVYARSSPATRGPPLAAKRIPDWTLPVDFSLSEADLIFGGAWPEQVWVHAKISRSGDPMQRSDDDVGSEVIGPLAPGAEGVTILLGSGI